MTTVRAAFGPILALALAFAVPLGAGAQAVPGSPQSVLNSLTNTYFTAVNAADGQALASATSSRFHVILPDGKTLSFGDFVGRLSEKYLNASTPVLTVKIGAVAIAATTATTTVETSSWDYRFGGAPHGWDRRDRVLERDYATHRLSWIKSADGAWLLDEDHLTSAAHWP
ncbi:MAG TPA: hypothetical protein VIJ64_00380 [Candidatus Lustribacter sp.]